MTDQKHVFLVLDDRFGVVSAALNLDAAVADLNRRVIRELEQRTLVNPGLFRLKSIPLEEAASVDQESSTSDNSTSEDLSAENIKHLLQINAQMFGKQLQRQVSELTAALKTLTAKLSPEPRAVVIPLT